MRSLFARALRLLALTDSGPAWPGGPGGAASQGPAAAPRRKRRKPSHFANQGRRRGRR